MWNKIMLRSSDNYEVATLKLQHMQAEHLKEDLLPGYFYSKNLGLLAIAIGIS